MIVPRDQRDDRATDEVGYAAEKCRERGVRVSHDSCRRYGDDPLPQPIDRDAVGATRLFEQQHSLLLARIVDDDRVDAPARNRRERDFRLLEALAKIVDLRLELIAGSGRGLYASFIHAL